MSSIYSRDYKRFLERLRVARLNVKMTQSEAAKRLGKRQSYVSKCESGERRVDAIELMRFAKLYRKALTFFLHD